MDLERRIEDIERLEEIFSLEDSRPYSQNDILAANRRHDQANARSSWFKLWQDFGVCCRPNDPELRLPDGRS